MTAYSLSLKKYMSLVFSKKNSVLFAVIILATTSLLLFSCKDSTGMVKASDEIQKQILPLSKNWLAIIDKGEMEHAYQIASDFFKKAISQAEFAEGMTMVLKPLGGIKNREVKDILYSTQMEALPDGEYVLVQYNSSFENKKKAVETLSLMKENNKWKVSGYHIK